MHKLVLGLVAAAGLAAVTAQPASAQASADSAYAWCAASPTIGTQCAFQTFEQCQADIFGLGGVCTTNPDYVAAPMRRPHR